MDFGRLFKSRRQETIQKSRAQKPCALPVGNNIMSAAGAATDHIRGVIWHINNTLRNVGGRNIQTGISSGLAMKPVMVQKIQACFVQVMARMMIKLGIFPSLSISQGVFPMSLQDSNDSIQNPFGNVTQLATKIPGNKLQQMLKSATFNPLHSASKSKSVDNSFGNQTENKVGRSTQNPSLQEDGAGLHDVTGHLQSANHMHQMVLKHEQVIEELVEENKKLHQILVEDLKISPNKLQNSYATRDKSPCTECSKCQRKNG